MGREVGGEGDVLDSPRLLTLPRPSKHLLYVYNSLSEILYDVIGPRMTMEWGTRQGDRITCQSIS